MTPYARAPAGQAAGTTHALTVVTSGLLRASAGTNDKSCHSGFRGNCMTAWQRNTLWEVDILALHPGNPINSQHHNHAVSYPQLNDQQERRLTE